MAVTKWEGGWIMTAVGDVAEDAGGRKIAIAGFYILNDANAGQFTFKDGNGVAFLTTNSLSANGIQFINCQPFECSGFEFDAKTGGGTGTVTVFGSVAS